MCYQIASERICGHVEVTHPSICPGPATLCKSILVEFRRPAKEDRLCFKCDPPLATWRAKEVHWYGYLREDSSSIWRQIIQELHEDDTIAKVEEIYAAQEKEDRRSLGRSLERLASLIRGRPDKTRLSRDRAVEVEHILMWDEEPRRTMTISRARQRVVKRFLEGSRLCSKEIMGSSSVTEFDRANFRPVDLGFPQWR
ncbi:hypothetical protein BDZ85DRAFT_257256 [Elsinoe ampelina]|uniref:Uncharacterized protein n=1 Tax=Elsinoe ampelina TaxID=302913 RepID=A0A6A6GP02_9PEZI|nr:hypothetical protein BDZ85DRAFT_257256 [Elsinoe ampelina]